jgi:tRNA-dihydrouridine synthase
MTDNFWKTLPKPIMMLAPMADVTDAAFRELIAKYGKPDIMYTEFVSADGLCSPGRDKLLVDFKYEKNQHPIVAQIFSSKPENIFEASKLIKGLGFDGIDINMGCPEKSICQQGCGAAMLKTPEIARACIRAAVEGGGGLPVSVKTRLGLVKREELEKWLPELLEEKIEAVIIHARTKKEMSKVPADWSWIKRAVEIRNQLGSKVLIIGNGDVENLEQARQ